VPKVKLNSTTSWLAILAAQGVVCAGASATPVTITETINLSQAVSSGGGGVSGLFDINSLLPTTGNYSDPLQLISATVAAYGYSNPSNINTTQTNYSAYQSAFNGTYTTYYYQQPESYPYYYYYVAGYYSYYTSSWSNNCGNSWSGCTTYYPYYAEGVYYYYYTYTAQGQAANYNQTRYATQTNTDATTDTLRITTAGGTTATGVDAETVTDLGSTVTYTGSGPDGLGTDSYYNSVDVINDYISGPLSTSTALNAASLDLLAQAGTLAYTLAADTGNYIATQLTLTVTLDQSPVPEPSTLSIFGFGLLLVAYRARRIKQRPSQN
jgi:hypothetical protein